jgi:hypothetical protein
MDETKASAARAKADFKKFRDDPMDKERFTGGSRKSHNTNKALRRRGM